MAVNLTTIARVKQFLGLDQSQSDKDGLIEFIIDGVSRQVAEHCGRTFEQTTYREWLDGSCGRMMRVSQYPITRLYGVSVNTQTAGTISYSGTGKVATAYLSSSELHLMHVTSSGVDTATDISLSGKTVSELSTSINAQTGWSFTVASGESNYPAKHIRPFQSGSLAGGSDYDLERADDMEMARVVSETDSAIELDYATFGGGQSDVFCWYRAGYVLPTEGDLTSGTVPKGLELVVCKICKAVFESTEVSGLMRSEKIGDYQYTVKDSDIIDGGAFRNFVTAYENELWPWVRKEF